MTKIVERELPDGLLCTSGSQIALNCAVPLEEQDIFEKYEGCVHETSLQATVTTEACN